MLQVSKAALIFRRSLVKKIEASDEAGSPLKYSDHIDKYKIFSPKIMHKLISNSNYEEDLEPIVQTVYGAILFADISGFTRLSARLNAEELKYHINQYFSLLLGVVDQNHGDVIKFCGDAVIVLWPVNQHATTAVKSAAVQLACLCSLHLLNACGEYDQRMSNDRPSVSLRLHCGIGCGTVHCMCLGDADRWEFLISGDPLRQVGQAEVEAGVGEVCISKEAYGMVSDKFIASEMPKGSYKLSGFLKHDGMTGEHGDVNSGVERHGSSSDAEYGNTPTAKKRFSFFAPKRLDDYNLHSDSNDSEAFRSSPLNSDIHTNSLRRGNQNRFNIFANARSTDSHDRVTEESKGSASSDDHSPSNSVGKKWRCNGTPRRHLLFPRIGEDASVAPLQNGVGSHDSTTSSPSTYKKHKHNDSRNRKRYSLFAMRRGCDDGGGSYQDEGESSVRTNPEASLADVGNSPVLQRERSWSENDSGRKPFRRPSMAARASIHAAATHVGAIAASVRASILSSDYVNSRDGEENGDEIQDYSSQSNRLCRRSLDRIKLLRAGLQIEDDPHVAEVIAFLSTPPCSIISSCSKSSSSQHKSPMTEMTAASGTEEDGQLVDLEESPAPVSAEEKASRIRLFVHEAARSAVEHNSVSYLAELRVVVTLFIQILGLEEDFLNGQLGRPQHVAEVVLRCLRKYGGSLRQYVVDDKGCVVIAAFGLPGSSHPDNCVRAIETAVRIRYNLNENGINCRVGITQGSVYCGLVGYGERCEYAMMGSSVNLAARFMGQAPCNDIIVSGEIYQDTKNRFEFKILPRVKAKGYTRPVPAYAPTHRMNSNSIHLAKDARDGQDVLKFITRESEQAVLKQALDSFIVDGGSHFYVITGAAGVGKKWLLSKLHAYARDKYSACKIISIAASSPDANSKYYCLRRIFDKIFMEQSNTATLVNNSMSTESRTGFTTLRSYTSEKARKLLTTSRSAVSAVGVNDDGKAYTDAIYMWMNTHARNVRVRDLDIGQDLISVLVKKDDNAYCDEDSENIRIDIITMDTYISDLVPLLEIILPIECDHTDLIMSVNHWVRVKLCRGLLLKILEIGILKSGVLLFIESLHWCDGPTMEILLKLLVSAKTGFFVATLRNSERPLRANDSELAVCRNGANFPCNMTGGMSRFITQIVQLCTPCVLQPLSLCEIQHMIEDTISSRFLKAYPEILKTDSLSQIIMRTGGAPYLTAALILTLRDALVSGRFRGIEHLPSGEHNIIVNRFDKLNSAEQMVLKVASVIGEVFTSEFLKAVLMEMGPDMHSVARGVDMTLRKLVASSLITFCDDRMLEHNTTQGDNHLESDKGETVETYKFNAKTIQESIYNLMLITQKETTHCVVGRILEQRFGRYPDFHFSQIAKHYLASNNVRKKISYLEESVNRAVVVNDPIAVDDCINKLLIIATGMDANALLEHCAGRLRNTSPSHVEVRTSDNAKALFIANRKGVRLPSSVHAKWLTVQDFRRNIDILELNLNIIAADEPFVDHASQFPNHTPYTPERGWSRSTHDSPVSSIEIRQKRRGSKGGEGDAAGSPDRRERRNSGGSDFRRSSRTGIMHRKAACVSYRKDRSHPIDIDTVTMWIAQLAEVHYRMGNYKMANNFAMLAFKRFGVAPVLIDPFGDVKSIAYRSRIWLSNKTPLPKSADSNTILELIGACAVAGQTFILRGQTAPADACLRLALRFGGHVSSVPSSIYIVRTLMAGLTMMNGELRKAELLMDELESLTPAYSQNDECMGMFYMCRANMDISSGNIGDGLVSIKRAYDFFEREPSVMMYAVQVMHAWFILLQGDACTAYHRCEEVLQFFPLNDSHFAIRKWSLELQVVCKTFTGDFNEAHVIWEKLKSLYKKDFTTATASSLIAFVLVQKKEYIEAMAYCRYACIRLSEKTITSPCSGVFLFLAGYSALSIIDCALGVLEAGTPQTQLPYKPPLPSQAWVSDATPKIVGPSLARRMLNNLKPVVELVLAAFRKAVTCQPVLHLFHSTLMVMKHRVFPEFSILDLPYKLTQLTPYKECEFGMAYFYKERALYLRTCGAKYVEDALKASELSTQIFQRQKTKDISLADSKIQGCHSSHDDTTLQEFNIRRED